MSSFVDYLGVNANIMNLGNKRGMTDYIDFIKISDLVKPYYKGLDCFNRPFVTMRVIVNHVGTETEYAQTFFQRYTEDYDQVNSGRVVGVEEFMDTCGGIRDNELKFIKRLIDGETVSGTDIPERCLRTIGGIFNDNIDPNEYSIRLGK